MTTSLLVFFGGGKKKPSIVFDTRQMRELIRWLL